MHPTPKEHQDDELQAGSSLRGSELVPSKWRCLVPGEHRDGAQSRPPAPYEGAARRVPRKDHTGRAASRWVLHPKFTEGKVPWAVLLQGRINETFLKINLEEE